MNFKKLTYCLLFLAFALLPCPSFSAEDEFPLNFIKDDHTKDRQALQKYVEERKIGDNAPINVLTIDGGGVRGIIPATFLEKLEAKTGLAVNQLFDFVAGTSTGGILALGLVTPIINPEAQRGQFRTASDMVQVYTDLSNVVFPPTGMLGYLFSWFSRSQYYDAPLEKELETIFENKTLRDSPIPTVITGVRTNDNSPYNFMSYRAAWDDDGNFFLKDVGRATSAAPTYFLMKQMKPVHGNGPFMSFTDGGLAANDPAIVALSEVYRLFGPRPVNLISLGTGACPKFNDDPKDSIYLLQASSIIETLWATQVSSVPQILGGLDPSLGDLLTYRRVQISLPENLTPMDCANNVGALRDIANRYFENDGKRNLDRISDLLVGTLNKRGFNQKPPRSVEERDDIYFYKPSQEGTLTLDDVLKALNPTVRTLNLSGYREVNDAFIKGFSKDTKSESLAIIDLSRTSITGASLRYILGSQILGTKREIPQINQDYADKAYSEIYLNVQGTNISIDDMESVKGFVDGFTLRYSSPEGVQTANDQVGMKRLRFHK